MGKSQKQSKNVAQNHSVEPRKDVPDERAPAAADDPVSKVVEYVDRLYLASRAAKVSLKEVLAVVTDAEEFLRFFRDRTVVEAAVKHIPDTVEALAGEARKGNVDAAKVLLEVVGLTGRAPRQQVNIANQINLSMEELAALKREVLAAADVDTNAVGADE